MKIALIIAGYMAITFLVFYLLCLFSGADEDNAPHFALIALAWPVSLSICIIVLIFLGPFYGLYKAAGATLRRLNKRTKK